VPGAATGRQRYFSLNGGISPDNAVNFLGICQLVGVSLEQTIQHFGDKICRLIDNFFH
jgi:hypothetical protein